ncbi:MAG: winged helix-turn-helix domain-containing protein [Gaiellales bacterium]
MRTVSVQAVRRHMVAAQGYAGRARRGRAREVEEVIGRLGAVQLDSISTVERSHRLALTSRVGAYPRGTVSRLLGQGRVIETWVHEACLVPAADWALWSRRMQERRVHHWYGPVIDGDPQLAEAVMAEIRDRGPLGSRHFEGTGSGGMWSWKPAKRMLDALWTAGMLVVSGRQGFQRLYDLPERVLPPELLDAPVPSEQEYLRAICLRAVAARGALTEAGIVEHARLGGGTARIRPHVQALVGEGRLERLAVDDGGPPVLVTAGAELDGEPTASVLLSPFDNLLWDRPFARRILGFDHLIEVYKPAHERRFGYYVLPLLHRDRIVGRADIKADRGAGTLIVRAYHPERGYRSRAPLERAAARLAFVLGVERVEM